MTRKLILAILLTTLTFAGAGNAEAKGVISERTDAIRKRARSTVYHPALKRAVHSLIPRISGEHLTNLYKYIGKLDSIRATTPQASGWVMARSMVETLGPSEAVKLAEGVATAASESTKLEAKTAATHLKLVRKVVAAQRSR